MTPNELRDTLIQLLHNSPDAVVLLDAIHGADAASQQQFSQHVLPHFAHLLTQPSVQPHVHPLTRPMQPQPLLTPDLPTPSPPSLSSARPAPAATDFWTLASLLLQQIQTLMLTQLTFEILHSLGFTSEAAAVDRNPLLSSQKKKRF